MTRISDRFLVAPVRGRDRLSAAGGRRMTDELMAQFLIEGRELVASAERDLAILSQRPDDAAALDGCFRAIHTLKGSTGLFDLVPMGLMLHAAEDLLTLLRAERTGSAADFEALLSVVDQVDRWLDVLERTGQLPPDAGSSARSKSGGFGI
jgi:two-component system chemotaxis sensor kinase CheA